MRFVLPLVALCAFSSAPLRADMFDITFSGSLSGNGTFTTNGTCGFCVAPGPLSSLTVNIGPDSGTDAFDISDDLLGPPFPRHPTFYIRLGNVLVYNAFNSETGDLLDMNGINWTLSSAESVIGSGTYSITPSVPEPPSLFLLMPVVALVGLRWRHQRRRAYHNPFLKPAQS